jgi:hypothetical protein
MEYQNKFLRLDGKRIYPVLKNVEWLEEPSEEPLDLTHLSAKSNTEQHSWFSQLDETERQTMNDRLAHLELIFRTNGEDEVDKILTDKNSQIINENFEIIRKKRRITKELQPTFEKVAA